jgi:ABC-type uncharacterized transport system YnjBCD substrate-binding protein
MHSFEVNPMSPNGRPIMRNLLLASALLALASTPLPATPHLLDDWSGIVEAAQGQTVYLHAWGETRASTRSLVTARLLFQLPTSF